MKKKMDKEPKSITFMVTKLVTINGNGWTYEEASQFAEDICTNGTSLKRWGLNGTDFSAKTETVIKVDKKA